MGANSPPVLSPIPAGERASTAQVGLMGVGLIVGFIIAFVLLIAIWPPDATGATPPQSSPRASAAPSATSDPPVTRQPAAQIRGSSKPVRPATPLAQKRNVNQQPASKQQPASNSGIWPNDLPIEKRYLILVAIAAALGSFIQLGTSFTTYLGNLQFRRQWFWWYLLRIPLGIALAEVFYFAIRAGFTISSNTGPYAVAALSGMVGLFSKQATDKLRDIFEELFNSKQDDYRKDGLTQGSSCTIKQFVPATLNQGDVKVDVVGKGFATNSTATVNGAKRNVTFTDPQHITIALDPRIDTNQAGTLTVAIFNTPGSKCACQDISVK